MVQRTRFGLVCQGLLDDFIKGVDSRLQFSCILYSQRKVAEAAASEHPELNVDPDVERTYPILVESFSESQPEFVFLKFCHLGGRNRYEAWESCTDERAAKIPNQNTVDAIKQCLRTWIEWDTLSRAGASPESPIGNSCVKVSTNDKRDEWFREQKKLGDLSLKEIRANARLAHPEWAPLENDCSVNSAIKRYEKRHDLSSLPRRKK